MTPPTPKRNLRRGTTKLSEIDTVSEQVREQEASGEWAEMRRTLDQAVHDYHADLGGLCVLALLCREVGEGERAHAIAKSVLEREPEDPRVLSAAGSALWHTGDPAGEAALRTAALMAPEEPYVRLAYGVHLAREGMVDDGIAQLLAAAALDEDDPVVALELGIAYALARRFEHARSAIARAVQLDPDNPWSRTLLGLVELEDDDVEAAAMDLAAAAELDPTDFEAILLAALAVGAAGWEERAYPLLEGARLVAEAGDAEAVEDAEDAIDDGPESAASHLTDSVAPMILRTRLQALPW